jgi:FkbM family methyltransferase
VRDLWQLADRVPGPVRSALRPAVAAIRRSRRISTPLPEGERPPVPDGAVELDTLFGTLWFDGEDRKLTPWIRRHATWEADVVRLLERMLRPGATFVDVGANVGFHSVVAARLVGPDGRVFSIEPDPFSLALLRANLWRHRCSNATVLPVAAAAGPGRVRLAPDAEGRSGSSLVPAGGIEVEAARLDDLLGGTVVDVLKVDVEGAEPLVVRGAQDTIARSPRLLAIVELRHGRHLDGSDAPDVLASYVRQGFELGLLRPSGETTSAGVDEVLAAVEPGQTTNIVLRRRDPESR